MSYDAQGNYKNIEYFTETDKSKGYCLDGYGGLCYDDKGKGYKRNICAGWRKNKNIQNDSTKFGWGGSQEFTDKYQIESGSKCPKVSKGFSCRNDGECKSGKCLGGICCKKVSWLDKDIKFEKNYFDLCKRCNRINSNYPGHCNDCINGAKFNKNYKCIGNKNLKRDWVGKNIVLEFGPEEYKTVKINKKERFNKNIYLYTLNDNKILVSIGNIPTMFEESGESLIVIDANDYYLNKKVKYFDAYKLSKVRESFEKKFEQFKIKVDNINKKIQEIQNDNNYITKLIKLKDDLINYNKKIKLIEKDINEINKNYPNFNELVIKKNQKINKIMEQFVTENTIKELLKNINMDNINNLVKGEKDDMKLIKKLSQNDSFWKLYFFVQAYGKPARLKK